MLSLRSARSRAIAAGALGLLLLASVTAVAGMAATTDQTGRSTLWLVSGLSAAAFVVVAATLAVVIVSTVRPLAALRASARAIAAGDSQARAKVSGPEEIASLARDFNEMTDALAAKASTLQESEARYRLLAENVTDVIWTMDTNLRFTYVSPSVTRMRGDAVEEMVGRKLKEILTAASLEAAMEVFAEERAIEERQDKDPLRSRTLELEQTCKDGSTAWVEAKLTILRNSDRQPIGILGITRDISERKRAEETLRAQRDKFEGVIASLADGLDIVSRDYRIHFQNKVLKDRFGDLTGKLCYEGYMVRETPCESCPMEKAIATGSTQTMEMTAADGREYEVTSTPFEDIDGETRVIEIVRDITDRKRAEEALRESEEKYRRLVQDSIDGIAILEGPNIRFANPALLEMFGCQSEEELVGHAFTEFLSAGYREALLERHRAREQGQQVPTNYELKALRKDGSELDVEVSIGRIAYRGKVATQVVVRDITERKRAEEALRKAREDIESRVERRAQEVNGYNLTFRELTVLHLVAAGQADKEIATVLGISPLTAHKHLANILDKMGAASRTEAGVRALQEGLLD